MSWERLWYGPRGPREVALWALLAPLSWAYAAVTWCWHAAFDLGWRASVRVAGARVVSVGNLVVGGAGKTPVTSWLVRQARTRGLPVAVLTRGYGRRSRAVRRVEASALLPVAEVGDEALLLARACPGVPVFVGADRVECARAAVAEGARVLVLDDGFQHRRLARDVDVLVDAGEGNGWVLPAGPLREPPSGRHRATVTWGRDGRPGTVRATHQLRRVRAPDGTETPVESLSGRPVVVLTGIARPLRLLDGLRALGVDPVGFHAFADHHAFTPAELAPILEQARAAQALLVTTEKDAVRLPAPAHVLLQEVELEPGQDVEGFLDQVLGPKA